MLIIDGIVSVSYHDVVQVIVQTLPMTPDTVAQLKSELLEAPLARYLDIDLPGGPAIRYQINCDMNKFLEEPIRNLLGLASNTRLTQPIVRRILEVQDQSIFRALTAAGVIGHPSQAQIRYRGFLPSMA